jgi:hypothetical protein
MSIGSYSATGKPILNDTSTTQADIQVAIDFADARTGESAATTSALPASGNKVGRTIWVSDLAAHRVWDGVSWKTPTPSGVDFDGWSFVTLPSGKRMYYREFSSWSAPNSFGAQGGSNWTQTRQATVPPPTGTDWSSFTATVSMYAVSTGSNVLQSLLVGFLSSTSGTAAAGLIFANPTATVIPNTNMNMKCAITLIEK